MLRPLAELPDVLGVVAAVPEDATQHLAWRPELRAVSHDLVAASQPDEAGGGVVAHAGQSVHRQGVGRVGRPAHAEVAVIPVLGGSDVSRDLLNGPTLVGRVGLRLGPATSWRNSARVRDSRLR